jgi:hypothetical protein
MPESPYGSKSRLPVKQILHSKQIQTHWSAIWNEDRALIRSQVKHFIGLTYAEGMAFYKGYPQALFRPELVIC